jgi:hypothetical protein
MNITKLAEKLRMTEDQSKSMVFHVVDFLMDNIPDEAIDAGAYHNIPANGDRNMIESYKAILWASFEKLDGQKPEAKGPWVHIDSSGISVTKERYPKGIVEIKQGF